MPPERPQSARSAVFGAVGDLALWGTTARDMQRQGPGWLLEKVRPVLDQADVLFGNLESVVLTPDYPADDIDPRGLAGTFDGTPELADAGFDFVNLANNHILDGGTTGLLHTVRAAEAHGLHTGGVGATQAEARQLRVLEKAGQRWGFLCYAEDSNYTLSTTGPCHAYYEPTAVLDDIARARAGVDVLVVSVHADLEFVQTPSVPRRDAFRAFAQAGATFVLGHHPHVPQGVELIGGSLIAYSLANFAFNAHTSPYMRPHLPNSARTFVLLAEVTRDGVQGFKRVPVIIGAPPDQRPLPAAGEAADALSTYLAELDRMVLDDELVARNWRDTAVRHLLANVRALATLDDPQAVLHSLGRLLHVRENRAWVDEVRAATEEIWDRQRRHVDPLHKPSFETESVVRAPRPSLLRRAHRKLRR